VIHSPTLTSAKYWPGELGKFSCYAIVYAKLMIDGRSFGVHPFMVQLRNIENYDPMPGVELGDIGAKFGYSAKDNGYCIFNQVRIPRSNMLRRFAEVEKDGNFLIKGDLKTLYSVMLYIRVTIAIGSPKYLGMALTIATRYAAVRRQFSTQDG
jgi:acyl-CoA oxidase